MVILSLLVLTGVIDIFVLMKLQCAFKMFRMAETPDLADKDLPTVSICISARNETHAMTQCLERVVASEYPKLEVIVLDDGSRDDTLLLIKSFAFAGVRFIEGKPLPEGWLGKNYAQSILANEASGKYVFFMDVDTLIERHTVARAVGYLLAKEARMVSFIPLRDNKWETGTLMTTMRHFWTMMRFTPAKPRATSNAWMIERHYLLEQLKTDTTLPLSMLFETTLARKLAETHKYRLVLGNSWLGMSYEKRYSSQIETSIRVLYPQCDSYTLQVAWLVLLLALTLVPYAVVWWQPWALMLIAAQFLITYYYLGKIWIKYRLTGAITLPLTVAQEIWLLILSVYHYKRGTVTWKGRPIQTPKRVL
jgi:glycosyltransferase involved in cell wall biosynthesis